MSHERLNRRGSVTPPPSDILQDNVHNEASFRSPGLGHSNDVDSDWGDRPPVRPSERRKSPRHLASPNEANMGWWVGDKFHSVAAHFRDISSGGARILTREEPPNKHVWIGLARPVETVWYPARVVRVRETSVGLIEVGLAFHSPCNSVLFDAVVQKRLLGVKTSY